MTVGTGGNGTVPFTPSQADFHNIGHDHPILNINHLTLNHCSDELVLNGVKVLRTKML